MNKLAETKPGKEGDITVKPGDGRLGMPGDDCFRECDVHSNPYIASK